MSDKNNINIGPDVRLKKKSMFSFFSEFLYCSAKWFSYYNVEPFGILILLSDGRMKPESFCTITSKHGNIMSD
jgi:hypothetical protein